MTTNAERSGQSLTGRTKALAKKAMFGSGLLRAWHRRLNRSCLTVAAFHRVLADTDPRFAGSNPTYTVTPEELDQCCELFARYYNPVTLDEIIAACDGRSSLPERALIISFDDGWQDNVQYGMPVLKRHRMPAVLFVATAFIGSEKGFWQEEVYDCVVTGRHPEFAGPKAAGRLIEALATMPQRDREAVIAKLPRAPILPRAMVDSVELQVWRDAGFSIGGHGRTHSPLTSVADPVAEFAGCREDLRALGLYDERATFSFPHGRMTPALVKAGRENGFRLLFTSEQELVTYGSLTGRDTIGRIEIDLRPYRRPGGELNEAELLSYLVLQRHSS